MRKTLLAIVLTVALIGGYSVWPFAALYALVRAVEARDEAAVAARLDVAQLKRDFVAQVLHAYRRITGAAPGLLTEQFALAVAASIADPMVARMVTSEAVADLLRTGWPSSALDARPAGFDGIDFDGAAWRLYASSEYGLGEFRLWVPVDAPTERQYRVTLTREGLTWRLSGVRLPAPIQERLARELIKAERLGNGAR